MRNSSLSHWIRQRFRGLPRTVGATLARMPNRSLCLEPLEVRALPSNVVLDLGAASSFSSYAGVGFQQNEVATLGASVNDAPDNNVGDFSAQIQWGDGGSSSGSLVYLGDNGSFADYQIKGTYIYQQANEEGTSINVTVNGPDGSSTSGEECSAYIAPMPSGIAGTPPNSSSSGQAQNVVIELGAASSIFSYSGVGFQENEVATIAVTLNGQPDNTMSDVAAQINWGDGNSWSQGSLVYQGDNGSFADYIVKGTHVYTQSNSNGFPIVVYATGADGTSTSGEECTADVSPMPSGIAGTTPSATGSASPEQVEVELGAASTISVQSGIAFQNKEVATLAASVNDQPDTNLGDFQADINWGDDATWSTGTLIYQGTNGSFADYVIEGGHTYSKPNGQGYPIVVYVAGPDGTSTSGRECTADVAAPPGISVGSLTPTQWDANRPNYDGTIDVSGGSNGYQNLQVTGLPSGLSASVASTTSTVNGQTLLTGTITISGTPTQSGTFNLKITLEDGAGDKGQGTATLTISPALTVGSLSPAQWTLNEAGYQGTIDVTGGGGSLSSSQVMGLPAGLSDTFTANSILITGTPTQSGTFTLDVSVTDSDGDQASGNDTLTITSGNSTIALGSLSPVQWNVNQPGYDGTIDVSGGSNGYQNLQVMGLPSGLSASVASTTSTVNGQTLLTGTITISGTPTQSGTFNLGVSLQDGAGDQGSSSYTLTIQAAASPLSLGLLSPTEWTINQPGYSGAIPVSGGANGYQALQVSGLPSGLSAELESASGSVNGNTVQNGDIEITGTPGQSGVFTLQVSLQDGSGNPVSGTYTLTIDAAASPITLGSLSPTQWGLGVAGYSGSISISGGNGTYSEQVTGLPTGLTDSLVGDSIQISGTPTRSGTFTLSVSVQDTAGNKATGTDALTINSAVTLGPLAPTTWAVNQPGYSGAVSVSGGSGVYSNLQVSGLPIGLSAALSGSTIFITGEPTQSGTFDDIAVSVQDSNGTMGSGTYSLTITSMQLTLSDLSPTAWTVKQPGYDGKISVSGGNGKYEDLQVSGLPPGLSARLSGSVILVTGTPTQTGVYKSISVSIKDTAGDAGSGTYTLSINPGVTIGTLDPDEWTVNQPGYDGDIPVSGGTGGYQGLLLTGLPAGLTYTMTSTSVVINGQTQQSGDILITGTPTRAGTFPFTISLKDGTGAAATDGVSNSPFHPDAMKPKQAPRQALVQRTLTIKPGAVDLTASVNGGAITPTAATDLNLSFFFGTETVQIPVTIQNLGPNTASGAVTLKLVLSTTPDGEGSPIALASKPVTLKNLASGGQQVVTVQETIPSTAKAGTSYYVVATVALPANSTMTDTNPNNNTGATSTTFEFVGTPSKTGAASYFWTGKNVPKGYLSLFEFIRNTLYGTRAPAVTNSVVAANPPASQAQNMTEEFIFQNENAGKDYLYPYTTSGDSNPTLGIGINLNSVSAASSVGSALAADVKAYYQASNPAYYRAHAASFANAQAVLNFLKSSAVLNRGTPVISQSDEWSLFRLKLQPFETQVQDAFEADGGTWDDLTARQQAAAVDPTYNTGSTFSHMVQDLASYTQDLTNNAQDLENNDLVRAAFDLVNAKRTTQAGNPGVNTRTEADLQMLVYSEPTVLGHIIVPSKP